MSAPFPFAPMVFVHGGAHGAWCWEPLIPFVDGDELAVDLPPKSVRGGARRLEPVPELRTLTVGDFADSVLRDVDGAGFERFVLVAERVSRAGIPAELPKTFVKLLRDQSLPPDHQDVLVQNLRDSPGGEVDVVTIDAGHDVMISRPKELADVLNRIAATGV